MKTVPAQKLQRGDMLKVKGKTVTLVDRVYYDEQGVVAFGDNGQRLWFDIKELVEVQRPRKRSRHDPRSGNIVR